MTQLFDQQFCNRILSILFLVAANTQANDFGLSVILGNQSVPVSITSSLLVPDRVFDERLQDSVERATSEINTNSITASFYCSFDDWSFGVSHQFSDKTQDAQLLSRLNWNIDFDQSVTELFASYYLDEWMFSFSYGESDYLLNQSIFFMSAYTEPRRVQQNNFGSDDWFVEMNTSYWFDLEKVTGGLSITPELHLTHYHTDSMTQQNSTTQFVDSSQLLYGVTTTLGYAFEAFSFEHYLSFWYDIEYASDSEGSTRVSRATRQRGIISREAPLDETSENSQTVHTYGIDYDLALNDVISVSVGALNSNINDWQWQAGVFVNF